MRILKAVCKSEKAKAPASAGDLYHKKEFVLKEMYRNLLSQDCWVVDISFIYVIYVSYRENVSKVCTRTKEILKIIKKM